MLDEIPIIPSGREGRKHLRGRRTVLERVDGVARDKDDVTGGDGERLACDGIGQVALDDIELLIRILMKMRPRTGCRLDKQFHRAITAARFFARNDKGELTPHKPIGRSSSGCHMDKFLRHHTLLTNRASARPHLPGTARLRRRVAGAQFVPTTRHTDSSRTPSTAIGGMSSMLTNCLLFGV